MAGTLASFLFWLCVVTLLAWHHSRVSALELFFFRWGLLVFLSVGTPLLYPVVEKREWLVVILAPIMSALLVIPLLYLFVRVFRIPSPFDEFELGSPLDDKPPPPRV